MHPETCRLGEACMDESSFGGSLYMLGRLRKKRQPCFFADLASVARRAARSNHVAIIPM